MTLEQPSPERIYLASPHMSGNEMGFIEEAFATNWISPAGPHLAAFEEAFAAKIGVQHAVAVSSGTAALHLLLRAYGIGRGDQVVCSSLTFVGSVAPILYQGACPVLIDSEETSWNLDPALLDQALTDLARQGKPAKAVIAVHLYGQCANLTEIGEICQRHQTLLIEDAAEALGSTYRNRAPGSFGASGFFSFNGNKIITTSGGGMITTNDEEIARKTRFLATQAKDPGISYEHSEIGYNYRLSNVLAGIGRAQLAVLDERVAQKRAVFQRYVDELGDLPGISFMPEAPWGLCTRWLTCILIDQESSGVNRDGLIESLAQANIESRPIWKPMHAQEVFADVPVYGRAVADRLFRDGLCLPSSSHLTAAQQDRVIHIIRQAWKYAQSPSPL